MSQINYPKPNFKYPSIECPEPQPGLFYFYILECRDNSLYCGSSENLKNRKRDHDTGKAAKWTRERRPVQLVHFETYDSHLVAQRRERQVKGWIRKKKENLIMGRWAKQKASR